MIHYTSPMHVRRFALVAIPLFFLLAGTGIASSFSDTASSAYATAIAGLEARGIVEGFSDGTFRPTIAINRAEFLNILMESRFPGRTPADLRCFVDLDVQTPQWYARTTCSAQELGIVQGYGDGTFRPDRAVQLDEALKMAMLAFGITPIATDGPWYQPYLSEARDRGILTPLLKLPAHLLTRGEMAEIAYVLVINDEDHETPRRTPVCGNGVTEESEQCDDGNIQDSDGCSSICILVPEPMRRAILRIDQQTTGTLTMIARGQKNVTLLKFAAVSGRQDSLLTSLVFEPSMGSLLYGQNYALMMDRDGDGIYERTAQASGKVEAGRLIFDAMLGGGLTLPKGLSVPFLVKADLVSTLGPVMIGLQFATSLPDYIEAQGAEDGLGLEGIETNSTCTAGNCFIRVNTTGSTNINVTDRGNLFITADTAPVRNRFLLNSAISDELLRLRVRADGEAIDLHTIRIDGVIDSVETLLLYRLAPGQAFQNGVMTPFAQASSGQCPDQPTSRFCAVLPQGTLIIDPAHDSVLAIAARMKSDQLGAESGDSMTLTVAGSTSMSDHAFDARGLSSQQELTQNDGNGTAGGEIFVGASSPVPNAQITGSTHDTTFARIASILNDASANENFIPSGFTPIGSFSFSAFPHTNSRSGYDDVVLQTLTFHVTAQNVQIDPLSFMLTTKNNPEAQLSCTAGASTGNFDVVCSGISSGTIQSRIGQGESVSYRLFANVTNGRIAPGASVLSVSLPILGQRNQTNSVQWSDQTTTFTWVDTAVTSVSSTVYRH